MLLPKSMFASISTLAILSVATATPQLGIPPQLCKGTLLCCLSTAPSTDASIQQIASVIGILPALLLTVPEPVGLECTPIPVSARSNESLSPCLLRLVLICVARFRDHRPAVRHAAIVLFRGLWRRYKHRYFIRNARIRKGLCLMSFRSPCHWLPGRRFEPCVNSSTTTWESAYTRYGRRARRTINDRMIIVLVRLDSIVTVDAIVGLVNPGPLGFSTCEAHPWRTVVIGTD